MVWRGSSADSRPRSPSATQRSNRAAPHVIPRHNGDEDTEQARLRIVCEAALASLSLRFLHRVFRSILPNDFARFLYLMVGS